jgi:hypothetical protein
LSVYARMTQTSNGTANDDAEAATWRDVIRNVGVSIKPMNTDMFGSPEPNQPWVEAYSGLSVDEVIAKAQVEGRRVRVIRPDHPIHADYHPDRLNVILDSDGEIERLASG